MGFKRIAVWACASIASTIGATPALAASKEPLIVTTLPDPDHYLLTSAVEPRQGWLKAGDGNNEGDGIDKAIQAFGRAIGQAAMVDQQQVEARCRSGQPESATPEQRFAWAASCRYTRR
jgi:hypothetical protein